METVSESTARLVDLLLLHLLGHAMDRRKYFQTKEEAQIGMANVAMGDARTLKAVFLSTGARSGLVHPCKRLLEPRPGSWRISKPRMLADVKILHWPNKPKKEFWIRMLVFKWGSR